MDDVHLTDIKESTRRREADGKRLAVTALRMTRYCGTAIDLHLGFLFGHTGDGVVAAFAFTEGHRRRRRRRADGRWNPQ